MKIEIETIGIIKTPFDDPKKMPIHPSGASDLVCEAILEERYAEGLKDLDGFSHIYLIYFFHKTARTALTVVPFMDTHEHGVFATRSPVRPAHIGLSIVELVSVEKNRLKFRGADMLDGTPLIDIKPYTPKFDICEKATSGWMNFTIEEMARKCSDERFT